MTSIRLFASLALALAANLASAQDSSYSYRHAYSAFAEYSNTSSHIILGVSRNRRLVSLGLAYSLRLLHSRYADWYYNPELHPFTLIQDPVVTQTILSTNSEYSYTAPIDSKCIPGVFMIPSDPAYGVPGLTYTRSCSTRWTYAAGLSPLGQRVNFAPRRRLQPFVVGNAGFLVTPRDVPVNNSSRFNFTFEFGAGLQLFRNNHHSWSAEYRIQHISNAYIGNNNPGIDSQVVKVTYTLAR
jgi:hypothetical protein